MAYCIINLKSVIYLIWFQGNLNLGENWMFSEDVFHGLKTVVLSHNVRYSLSSMFRAEGERVSVVHMKWWMQSLKASRVCFTVVLSACSLTSECDHISQVGLRTPRWINSSNWLFQTSPLTPSALLSISHKTPPPSLQKATEIITSSLHHTTCSAFSLHLYSYPGSRPSHLLMESSP